MNISPNGINIDEALEALAACTVWYPDYREAMRVISKCIDTTRHRKDPSSAMLIGPTGVGKTRLCRMIEKDLGPTQQARNSECDKKTWPCVYIELPESATIRNLSVVMAKVLGGNPTDNQSVVILEDFIIQRLVTIEAKLVILDDFHHVAEKGLTKTKSSLCNWIIKLLNRSGVAFLISGSSSAEETIDLVEELSDRFPYRAKLQPLPMADKASTSVLLGVLAGLEKEMIKLGHLKEYTHLTDPTPYKAIYLATRGNFRRLSDLLHDSFEIALLRGDYTLKISDFAEAAADLAFCCCPNYFLMSHYQLNFALKFQTNKSSETAKK